MATKVVNVQGRTFVLYPRIPQLLANFASPVFCVSVTHHISVELAIIDLLQIGTASKRYLNLVCYSYVDCFTNNFTFGRQLLLKMVTINGGEIENEDQFLEVLVNQICKTDPTRRAEVQSTIESSKEFFVNLFSSMLPFKGQSPISLLNGYFETKQQHALNIKYVSGTSDNGCRMIPLDSPTGPLEVGRLYFNPTVIHQAPENLDGVFKKIVDTFTKLNKSNTYCIHGLFPKKRLLKELAPYWSFIKIHAELPKEYINVTIYHDRVVGDAVHQILARFESDVGCAVFYSSFIVVQQNVPESLRDLHRTRFLYMLDTKAIDPVPKNPEETLIYMVTDIKVKVGRYYDNVLTKSRHCVEGPLLSAVSERGIHHMNDKKVENEWFRIHPGVVYTLFNWPQTDNLHDCHSSEVIGQSNYNY